MENQITTLKWVTRTLSLILLISFNFSSFAQSPGNGPHGPGNPGVPGGHHGGHGGPGNPGGHPHPPIPCNAQFNQHRDTIINGIQFTNFNGSPSATYAWDFGDGSTSTASDPTHAYASPGTYYVCLTVTDTINGGCSNTKCDSIRVFTPGPRCRAHFKARRDTVANGVRFMHSRNPTSAIYSWDFGDGSTSSVANPVHAYTNPGIYWVCLTVTNSNAVGTCSVTYCDSINTDSLRTSGSHPHHHRLANTNKIASTISADALVSIYPNPIISTSTIFVDNTSGNAIFSLYQMNGQLILTKELNNGNNEISKGNLSNGIYFYSVDDSGNNIAKGKIRVY